ncbi:WhiB family transcriptional regulator [Phycicoccus sp. M110.8]|uniref:WhiB family transcriptional regulator n=1 Tax=Phycicoccus sp. M110.8 TaxID=3075433 RepID=UPI0028FCFDD2|nr:WhiB family transcriptional regulator [Phycicoccus sp. M110.8]MDU0313176.1 WhiB family transcriptional regulator [Phycicoccus sp. M110.8]
MNGTKATTEAVLAARPDLRHTLARIGQEGKCVASSHPQAWFVSGSGYFNARNRARTLCDGCPVLAECRDYALAAGEEYGVWGGLCEVDRAVLRQGATARERDLLKTRQHPFDLFTLQDAG